jgi:hypothetical protein
MDVMDSYRALVVAYRALGGDLPTDLSVWWERTEATESAP